MEWQDKNSILISRKRYGERNVLLKVFSHCHGIWNGFISINKQNTMGFEIGDMVDVKWRGRLRENLGRFTLQNVQSTVVYFMRDRVRLLIFQTCFDLIDKLIPERSIEEGLYEATIKLLYALRHNSNYMHLYIRFELELLKVLGFSLQLDQCAVSGKTSDLFYISPKSGRAVSKEAGFQYKDRLIILPEIFITGSEIYSNNDFYDMLSVTEYFMNKQLNLHFNKELPIQRASLKKYFNIE